tara:strand:- start:650 stop:1240 length:591 start_codon:yes stop_codon:yes gene_type:complete
MYKLGITGGIGAGKTTASHFFEKKKARIFNADREAKSHLKKTITLQHKIIESFGKDVVENNKLSLKKLAEVSFSNKLNQEILNGIMWPEVYLLIDNAIEQAQLDNIQIFIIDAAMLFEAKINNILDSILLITAKKSIRIERAKKRKNLALEQIQNRMSLQISEKIKKIKSNYTINNNGTIDQFYQKLEEYYNSLSL